MNCAKLVVEICNERAAIISPSKIFEGDIRKKAESVSHTHYTMIQ